MYMRGGDYMKKSTKAVLVGGLLAVALVLGFSLMSGRAVVGDPPFLFFFK